MQQEIENIPDGCIIFTKWRGENGIENYIKQVTGCNPFSGSGININLNKKTAILKSVDNTPYYADNLDELNNVYYTLYGRENDQDINESRFNKNLINENITQHIYLYRVIKKNKKTQWVWYGKYNIKNITEKMHPDINGNNRKIYLLNLIK